MKRKFLKLTVGMFLSLGVISANAQTTQPINVVTTAVPFLRISPDARAGGMGDLGLATSPDANAPFWNLAKVPFAQKNFSVGLTYTPWLKDLGLNDVYLLALAGYYKLDEDAALAGSVRYFSLGNIQFTDASGNDFGSGRPREFGVDFGYTRKLSDKIGLGVALRYIHSNLAGNLAQSGTTYKPGSTVAGDLSFFYNGTDEAGQGFNFGATLTNLGGKIGYTNDATQKDYIPANLSFGTTYTKAFDEANKITFGIDVHKLLVPTPPTFTGDSAIDNPRVADYRNKTSVSSWFSSFNDAPGGFKEELKEFQISLGAEYNYNDQFFFRTGYFYEDKTKGNRKYFTVGLGVKYNVFGLNFSYLVPSGSGVNRNPLSNTLRFGLIFDLDDINAE
ncbi:MULTISPECIES: type IX secretion system outer membrane channel protein PorV [Niastella]|uniref:Type IX secretion system outer membrane channel protein PorV n=1 Tax=Niastella soli TaxID=2821487 RepID=A0ABS3YRC8_9BACT|nr:type IX secretion system outer membrane channel protein PorV [Niastella soli]MBO9200394.1 type IX secretion system outer membrane channel protein PorV [Niastella soli]